MHRRAGHSGTQTRTSSPSPLTSCLFSGRRLQKTASQKPVGPRASPAATAPWPGASLSPPSSAFGASHDSCRISRNLEFIILRFPCTRTTLIVSNDQPQSRQQTKARPRHSPSSVPPGAAAVACSRSLNLVLGAPPASLARSSPQPAIRPPPLPCGPELGLAALLVAEARSLASRRSILDSPPSLTSPPRLFSDHIRRPLAYPIVGHRRRPRRGTIRFPLLRMN